MIRHIFSMVLFAGCSMGSMEQSSVADAMVRDAGIGSDSLCQTGDDCTNPCPPCSPPPPPPTPTCVALGCEFAPWGWCGPSDTTCTWNNHYSADPAAASCEHSAVATCNNIGYPIAECYITLAQDCSTADLAAGYKHCLQVTHQAPGSTCRLQWR